MFVCLFFSLFLGCTRHVTSILTRGDAGTEGDHRTCPSQEAPAAQMSPRASPFPLGILFFFPSKEVFLPVSADSLEVELCCRPKSIQRFNNTTQTTQRTG